MTIQKPFVHFIAIFSLCCGVDAWIFKGPTSQMMLSSTSHSRNRRSSDNENDSSSRRSFFETSGRFLLLPAATITVSFPAYAKYGEGTSMNMPSYIDYLIEKNTATDISNALYKGADPATVLKRLAESERRLGEIGDMAEKKKWSEITGLITGPLGTLGSSMSQIVVIASASATPKKTKQVEQAVKRVKSDVFSIGQEASRRNAEGCTQQALLASKDLRVLLELAFE